MCPSVSLFFEDHWIMSVDLVERSSTHKSRMSLVLVEFGQKNISFFRKVTVHRKPFCLNRMNIPE